MGKRLVVCCDGTWKSLLGAADTSGLTNVARLFLSVPDRAPDGTRQLVRYIPGVGTGNLERVRGGMFGYGLSRRVKQAYRFLVENYEPGDELWLFGFSRGAFTARSTAGLVRQASILRAGEAGRIGEAYRLYRSRQNRHHPDAPAARRFRARHSHPSVGIHFIGVWGTVGALGFPAASWSPLRVLNAPWTFHDTTLSSSVAHARHAVALDECRGPFRPTLWRRSDRAQESEQTLEQIWFCGVHSDVGGGVQAAAAERARAAGLSQVAFEWMLREAQTAGLAVDWRLCPRPGDTPIGPADWMVDRATTARLGGQDPRAALAALAVAGDPLGPGHESRRGLYRLMRPHRRAPLPYCDAAPPEGDGAVFPGQRVADSARARWASDAAYRARSAALDAYLKAGGAVSPVGRAPWDRA